MMLNIYGDKDILQAALGAYDSITISEGGDNSFNAVTGKDGPSDWTVISTFNDSGIGGSGMQAYVIDTGDGNCIISFRGTSPDNLDEFVKDVMCADIGMLNNGETAQQQKAREYVEYLMNEVGLKDRYQNFTFTGHSLGGNLAESAAITVPEDMRERCNAISLDGPGFSKAYIEAHREEIQAMSDQLTRYKWSMISGFLKDLPGETSKALDINPEVKSKPNFFTGAFLYEIKPSFFSGSLLSGINYEFAKHTAYDLVVDENGNFPVCEDKDSYKKLKDISSAADEIARLISQKTPYGQLFSKWMSTWGSAVAGQGKRPSESVTVLPSNSVIPSHSVVAGTGGGYHCFSVNREGVQRHLQAIGGYSDAINKVVSELTETMSRLSAVMSVDSNLSAAVEILKNDMRANAKSVRSFSESGVRCMNSYGECETRVTEYAHL